MHRRSGVQADPGMAMHVVVLVEEHGTEGAGVFDRAEPARESRAVFQGFEVGLRVGVVVGHVRSAVAAVHAEVDQQLGDRFGGHRGAAVGVQGQLVGFDAVVGEGVGDELRRSSRPRSGSRCR